jgi:hypothetical protein
VPFLCLKFDMWKRRLNSRPFWISVNYCTPQFMCFNMVNIRILMRC